LWLPDRKTKESLLKVAALTEKNLNLSFFLAFDRLKRAAVAQRSDEKTLKNLVNLLQRI
jgi:hypothetical protein